MPSHVMESQTPHERTAFSLSCPWLRGHRLTLSLTGGCHTQSWAQPACAEEDGEGHLGVAAGGCRWISDVCMGDGG